MFCVSLEWLNMHNALLGKDIALGLAVSLFRKALRCINQFQLRPAPHQADPWELAFFALDGKFSGVGTLSCQIPRGEDKKRGQMRRPPSTLQHFSLIAQSSSALSRIWIMRFCVSINVFLRNSAILIKTLYRDDTSL